jgi:hypothetical protein
MSNSLLSSSHKFEKFKGSADENENENENQESNMQDYNNDFDILNDNEQKQYDDDISGALNDISEILHSPEAKELCHDVCNILTSNESFTNMNDVNQDVAKLMGNKNNSDKIKDAELKAIDAASILLKGMQNKVVGNEKFQNKDKTQAVLSAFKEIINQSGTNREKFSNKTSSLNTCEKLHIPMHGQLSNSCDPVKLFSTEYNAQGLDNQIMGQNINEHLFGANI